jgi:hypothetical protein
MIAVLLGEYQPGARATGALVRKSPSLALQAGG